MKNALAELGSIHSGAGKLSVLRVVVFYPGGLQDDTVVNIAENNQNGHLLATVDLEKIVTQYDDIQTVLSLRRKRSAQEDGGSQPKHRRIDSSRAKGMRKV